MLKFKLASMVIISLVSFSATSAVVINGGVHGTNGGQNSVHVGESATGNNTNGKDGASVSVNNPQIENDVQKTLCADAFLRQFISSCKK
ncbi:hypothetical protein JEM67_26290 [Serratia sp. PAMC26656]|uniref:hypothetical protein n=1 Tax=Serratia sp. PAMC26656 TaxID=2775909 RepID=UPI0018F2DDBF|nr:hypothetical protein [Serratia sp. PAMC26656]MBJ7893516.1 hypothetical protein [Serratia sp. PAMC26656]